MAELITGLEELGCTRTTGEDQTVCVLSDSFNQMGNAADLQASGDLPEVEVVKVSCGFFAFFQTSCVSPAGWVRLLVRCQESIHRNVHGCAPTRRNVSVCTEEGKGRGCRKHGKKWNQSKKLSLCIPCPSPARSETAVERWFCLPVMHRDVWSKKDWSG